jgi:hypothetical protein
MVNQYYFYCVDADFGPFFLKFSSYFPYNAKLCLNGHEYVKRQLEKEGIGYVALGVRRSKTAMRLMARPTPGASHRSGPRERFTNFSASASTLSMRCSSIIEKASSSSTRPHVGSPYSVTTPSIWVRGVDRRTRESIHVRIRPVEIRRP